MVIGKGQSPCWVRCHINCGLIGEFENTSPLSRNFHWNCCYFCFSLKCSSCCRTARRSEKKKEGVRCRLPSRCRSRNYMRKVRQNWIRQRRGCSSTPSWNIHFPSERSNFLLFFVDSERCFYMKAFWNQIHIRSKSEYFCKEICIHG
jgi:hypothetical protein